MAEVNIATTHQHSPHFKLQHPSLHRCRVHKDRNSYIYYNTTSPLLLKPAFPLTLRRTRVVFLLLIQFPAELATEVEVILTLLIKPVSGEAEAGETQSGWMRVLAMEIMRGCVFLFLS